uniref:Secreted protein n=1 Tax=Heterorhabditis bacteriophora TaxID=37862 RepID=A0A1I7XL45_HETBA
MPITGGAMVSVFYSGCAPHAALVVVVNLVIFVEQPESAFYRPFVSLPAIHSFKPISLLSNLSVAVMASQDKIIPFVLDSNGLFSDSH